MSRGPGVRLWTRLARGISDDRAADGRADLQAVVDSIREHLSWLLNTRQGDAPICGDYGLPDISGLVARLGTCPKSERAFCAAIEEAIRKHEPRVARVSVRHLGGNARKDMRMNFLVELGLVACSEADRRRMTGSVDIDTVFTLSKM